VQRFPSTKRRPPSSAGGAIARPRLEAALDAALHQQRATLVLAPAGYGKTTTVARWLATRGLNAAWFTFDPGDDGPRGADVSLCLAAAIDGGSNALADWLGAAGDAPTAPAGLDAGALAAIVEASGWRGSLVLDDVHHLTPEGSAQLATWVERAPDGIHTLILARHAPALPVARWLTRNDAVVLGVEALRLDADEGRTLIASLLPDLAPAHATALLQRVEGWPAGIQLAARSLRGRHDPADHIERFTGTDRYVLAFLTEEVLLRLPDTLHEAALLLAGEPRLCAGLVDAITLRHDGAAILSALEAREAFLERLDAPAASADSDGPWYRFPDFFRDLLTHRLGLTHPDLAPVLRRRARAWWDARPAAPAGGIGRPLGAATPAPPPGLPPLVEALTDREHAVLQLLASGASTKAIARALEVSPNTVKTHTRHLFEKLGVTTRTEAASVARSLGLVTT